MNIALIWGCGLGDWIVAFPVIRQLTDSLGHNVVYFTKSSHVPKIFLEYQSLNPRFQVVFVPKGVGILAVLARYCRRFDCVATLAEHGRYSNHVLGYGLLAGSNKLKFLTQQWIGTQFFELFPEVKPVNEYGPDSLSFTSPLLGTVETSDQVYVLLHPFARQDWQTTRWPEANWASLITWLVSDMGLQVRIVGDRVDKQDAESLLQQIGPETSSAVRLVIGQPLAQVVALAQGALLAICHNSGLMHVFAQVRTETVVISGSSAACWRRPESWVHNIDSGLCQLKCNRRQCILAERDARCINGLSVERVKFLVAEVMRKIGTQGEAQVPLLPDS